MSAKGSKKRFANGVIAAVILVFFLAHASLGSLSSLVGYTSPFMWLVWVGVAVVAVHVVASVVTSFEQLNDQEHPPSSRKKRHLTLKLATGALLAASIVAHILSRRVPAIVIAAPFLPRLSIVVLSAVLAWHICVGMKSLLDDIGLSNRLLMPLRVVVCAFAVAFCLAVFASSAL